MKYLLEYNCKYRIYLKYINILCVKLFIQNYFECMPQYFFIKHIIIKIDLFSLVLFDMMWFKSVRSPEEFDCY